MFVVTFHTGSIITERFKCPPSEYTLLRKASRFHAAEYQRQGIVVIKFNRPLSPSQVASCKRIDLVVTQSAISSQASYLSLRGGDLLL